MAIWRSRYGELEAIRVSTADLELTVVPECGGKMVSLRSTHSGRQWLWQDPARPVRRPSPGGHFAGHDISGWDECFPTIGACPYPGASGDPFDGVLLDDHGELWSRPWQWETAGESLRMIRAGVALPYIFERVISGTASGGLRFGYRVDNLSDCELRFLWSAHPLLRAENGMRIYLPPSAGMTKEFGHGGRIGADGPGGARGWPGRLSWPMVEGADGAIRDLSLVVLDDPPVTDKVVIRGLAEGWAELAEPSGGERLRLEFPLSSVPYLGVCMNYGAWPFGDRPGAWLALEPASGGTDRLDDAVADSAAARLEARGTARWYLELSVRDVRR